MNPKVIRLSDYKRPSFNISKTELEFDIYEDFTLISSTLHIKKLDLSQKDLLLDAIDLELLELSVDGVLKDSTYEDEKLIIKDIPDSFILHIKNKIYPDSNTELEGLYRSSGIYCTQNEPEGFRRITPYLDRPDVLSVFKTTIKASKDYPILLSNGNLLESFSIDEHRHGAIWLDPFLKPTYLFAVVAGDLGVYSDEFITMSGKRVVLNIYVDKGNESKCAFAMESLKNAMKWDEQSFDREYDLELYNIVAVDSFNMGAMENKGLNIFNSHYVLADEFSAVDSDFLGIENVIAHEYFHNWSGNRVTCANWFELTLKEGLTVFRDQSFSADMNSPSLQRIIDVKALRDRQFSEDASPMAHPIKPDSYIAINNFYTSTIYEKGAEVIRMLQSFMGKDNFKKGLNIYFNRYDGKAVGTEEFLECMGEVSSIDMELFKRWYTQSRTPKLEVCEGFSDGVYSLKLTQKIDDSADKKRQLPFYYPLNIALLDEDGDELITKGLTIKDEEQTFEFKLEKKPILSINRDFSAPIIIKQKEPNYNFLMKYDKNGFARYESTQNAMLKNIKHIMQSGFVSDSFLEAYEFLLGSAMEPSLKAYMLELPTINAIIQDEQDIDFELICNSKDMLESVLSSTFSDRFLDIYETNQDEDSTALDALSMGKRALKNTALKFLKDKTLAKGQYYNSKSMNDKVAALRVLADLEAHEELEHFYTNYAHHTALAQKYYAIIASSQMSGLLSKVLELESDKYYDQKVPNLLRSLIGSFAKNARYFHAKDGSGYRFIASKIVELDSINTQMASAFASSFRIYPKLSVENRDLLKLELEYILSKNNISKNLYEVVDKIIKG